MVLCVIVAAALFASCLVALALAALDAGAPDVAGRWDRWSDPGASEEEGGWRP